MKVDQSAGAPRSAGVATGEIPPGEIPPGDCPGPFTGRLGPWFAAAIVVTVGAAVALRFITRSDLWLDEAMTVNLARRPLGDLGQLLRHDGAPPLYYVLLYGWMKVFGTGDLAARSLAGVIGVAALLVAWFAGRRLGGRSESGRQWVAWSTLLVVATSPYAIRYSTEARMYELEILLVFLGYLAVWRALERPSIGRLAAVAVVTALLLYTQYWAFYLVVVAGAGLLWRGARGARSGGVQVLGAIAVGCLAFVPWLPTFFYQLVHTGTPWGKAVAPPTGAFTAITDFVGSSHVEGYTLLLPVVLLVTVALFGRAVDRSHVELDLRTRPGARWEGYAAGATLLVGLSLSFVARSAFQSRYASIMFPLFALVVAYGITAFASKGVRYGTLVVLVSLGLVGGVRNVVTNRTQAGQVADHLRVDAHDGDVVAYCPDQVGPDTARLLHSRPGLRQYTFPSMKGPDIVDWVDYADRNHRAHAKTFAREVLDRAGPAHDVWLVWSSGYRTLGMKCEQLVNALASRGRTREFVVEPDVTLFEHQGLVRYRAP